MSALQDEIDPQGWIELTEEEKRCLLGLQKYWMIFMEKTETDAMALAWQDLKREFPTRLATATWWK